MVVFQVGDEIVIYEDDPPVRCVNNAVSVKVGETKVMQIQVRTFPIICAGI